MRRQLDGFSQRMGRYPLALNFGQPAQSVIVSMGDDYSADRADVRLGPGKNGSRLLGIPRRVDDERAARAPNDQPVGRDVLDSGKAVVGDVPPNSWNERLDIDVRSKGDRALRSRRWTRHARKNHDSSRN